MNANVNYSIDPLDLRVKTLNVNQRLRLEKEIKTLEREIGGVSIQNAAIIDCPFPEEVRRSINQKKRSLARFSPPPLTSREKDELSRRAKILEAKIKEHMLTQSELDSYEISSKTKEEVSRAVSKGIWYSRNIKPLEFQLKEIYRRLEPEDRDITNLNRLRT